MHILITGGAGFIGSNFARFCLKKGHKITILDNLTYAGGLDTLHSIMPKIKFVKGDVCNAKDIKSALINVDTVVHFAAESHNTRSETDADTFYKTNYLGTKTMLEESAKAGTNKFIQISTDEVYGPIERGRFKEEDKLNGDEQATSPYAKSKSLADDLVIEFGSKKSNVIVTRGTNNFGPYQHPEKLIPRIITNLLLGKKIQLWGKGKQIRDWLFVEDHCNAIYFLIQKGKSNNAYNIASNNIPEISNYNVAVSICNILNLNPNKYISYISDPRPNHDFRYSLDTTKIEKLGFKIQNDFYENLKFTVNWYKENEAWWKKRKSDAERIYI